MKCHAERHTNMNAAGPYITDGDMKNLAAKAERLTEGDYLVLAGVTPEYLEDDVEKMLAELIENKVKVCLDTNPSLMNKMLKYKPFMIKTTSTELGEMTGEKVDSEEDTIAAARKVHEMGAENVLILYHSRIGMLVCDKGAYKAEILHHDKAVNTVGTGDSLIAGFLMSYLRSRDALDSFRFGVSCGSATAYSKGLATKAKIDAMYKDTELISFD